MQKVIFYTKNRNKIEFECKKIEITRNGVGVLIDYFIDFGASENKIMYIRPTDIEAIKFEEY
ncbi:hypothetical protein FC976_13065 [Clostridium sporogenes]|uniref:hypothetical protein n=1 Tax=Clostridium sporogenes TaxID=1509 RepID=UPI0013D7579E|nr:hypothetical protein [Clostridium sporogenes]NFF69494.1 hypothetical protein [Clostridium sporogenes]NFG00747.1 hypothetical protein [Clostridium sporogenes]NFG08319.1 hypothetical protein [Clostridium sporogenes]NFG53453.1 hypothetical protein [Clostridium sporogenes]NFH48125.1 hypothetical protein [Clostridium sporogenes]